MRLAQTNTHTARTDTMGIKLTTHRGDLHQLSEEVGRARRHIDQTIEELTRVRDRIPGPREVEQAFAAAAPGERTDVCNACLSLELSLAEARKWAAQLASKTD